MTRPLAAWTLPELGFIPYVEPRANRSAAELVELALVRGEARLTSSGALAAFTGRRTGRSPDDKYIARTADVEPLVNWGRVNQPFDPAAFDRITGRAVEYLRERECFLIDGAAGADERHRIGVRVVCDLAWHALFAKCLFLRPGRDELAHFRPDWTVLTAAGLDARPDRDGTRGEVFIGLNFQRRVVVIVGTAYAGEIKKSIFTVLNYVLPQRGVFPMHCAANLGRDGDTALFFGLSGTGKTTLSADPDRRLIGDDEHGWSDDGVFNLEGGCYAKTIRLSPEGEPQIYRAIRFGCVLENVPSDPVSRDPDYADESVTENTRAAYPVDYIPNCELSGRGGHPANLFFLTCDATGVLPPIARLTEEQAMYHFLSGYTAKVAGAEAGVTEPRATFSTCFAAPFLPLPPARYAELLREKMQRHHAAVWLVNTGWSGGPPGVGRRMPLRHTRAMLRAALAGELARVPTVPDAAFHLGVPVACPGVPGELLQPRGVWPDPTAYDAAVARLADRFRDNFRQYADSVEPAVRAAGPA